MDSSLITVTADVNPNIKKAVKDRDSLRGCSAGLEFWGLVPMQKGMQICLPGGNVSHCCPLVSTQSPGGKPLSVSYVTSPSHSKYSNDGLAQVPEAYSDLL